MTWGEVKLVALQTMFSNDGEVLVEDDVNREYLNAMPGKANEALQQLALVGHPLLKTWKVRIDADAESEAASTELLILPVEQDSLDKIALRHYLPRFRCLHGSEVMLDAGGIYGTAEDWRMEGDDVFVIPGEVAGTYTLCYRAYPQTITAETPDSEDIDLAPEAAALIPLYIAGELYKEDDPSLATL